MKITDKILAEYGPDAKLKYVGSLWGGFGYTTTAKELQDDISNTEYDLELDNKNVEIPLEDGDPANTWEFDLDEIRVSGKNMNEKMFEIIADEGSLSDIGDDIDSEEEEAAGDGEPDLNDERNLEDDGNMNPARTESNLKSMGEYLSEKESKIKEKPFKNTIKTIDTTQELESDKAPKLPKVSKKGYKVAGGDKKASNFKIPAVKYDMVDHSIFAKGDEVIVPGGLNGKITKIVTDDETKAQRYAITLDNGEKVEYPEADLTRKTSPFNKQDRGIAPLKTFESYYR